MEEANPSFAEHGGVGRDDVSAPMKWDKLFREFKHSTVSTVRNMKLPQYEHLAMSVPDFEQKISWLKKHVSEVASRNKSNLNPTNHESLRALEAELDSGKGLIRELMQKISRLETDLGDRDREIVDLKLGLKNARESSIMEKTEIVAENESKVKSLEQLVRECDAKRGKERKLDEDKQRKRLDMILQLIALMQLRYNT